MIKRGVTEEAFFWNGNNCIGKDGNISRRLTYLSHISHQ